MDIERLKELREEVFEDYKAYMVKNLKDEDGKVYPSTVPIDECSPIGKDLLKLIDEAIARQSEIEKVVCPDCGGSGVYKEYDEYDRYYVHACGTCDGTGEIARKSVKSEDVQRAIKTVEGIAICSSFKDQREDAKLAITALQAYQPWIPVSERLPERPEYDWVLVHITLSPDGFVGLPHVAELRRGKWFSTEYDLPIEQILQGTVTHWRPLPPKPEGKG